MLQHSAVHVFEYTEKLSSSLQPVSGKWSLGEMANFSQSYIGSKWWDESERLELLNIIVFHKTE